jgi:hypothetical protein
MVFDHPTSSSSDPELVASPAPSPSPIVLLAQIPSSQQGPARFVLNINLVIYALILSVVFWRLPRTLSRLSKSYEWKDGFILGYKTPSRRKVYTEERGRGRSGHKTRAGALSRSTSHREGGLDAATGTGDHELASDDSHLYLVNKLTTAGPSRRHRYVPLDLPPHIPSTLLQPLYPIAAALRVRLAPSLSLGSVCVIAVYIAIIAYAVFVGNNLFSEPQRAGYVAMAQIPLVFALAGKCNVVGMLMAVGYEKVGIGCDYCFFCEC